MAFIKGVDTFDSTKLGQSGSAVIGAERDIYYSTATTITSYDPAIATTEWNRIYHVDAFDASDTTNKIDVYDGRSQTETKEGKVTSTMKITQTYKGFLNSVSKLKGQQLWFAEALSDDRQPLDDQGRPLYYEVYFVNGKLTNVTNEKGDAEALYKTTGEGAYNVTSDMRVFKDITPTAVTVAGLATAVGTTGATLTVTAKDFKGIDVDLTSLSAPELMGEITSITIIKTTGTPVITTIEEVSGNNELKVKFTGTGAVGLQAKVTTANGGAFLSNTLSVTIS